MTDKDKSADIEVIAVKSTAMVWLAVFAVVFSSGFLVWLVIQADKMSSFGADMETFAIICWLFVALVAGILCYAVYLLVKVILTPKEIVVAMGDSFSFCGNRYMLADITAVEYRRSNSKGISCPFGRLIVRLKDGTVLKCRFVADVEKVHNRLYALIDRSKERLKNGEDR